MKSMRPPAFELQTEVCISSAMGLNLLRLRRSLTSSTTNLHRSLSAVAHHSPTPRLQFQSRSLKSSSFSCAQLSHNSSNNQNDDTALDSVLFEARMAHLRRSMAAAQPSSSTHQLQSQAFARLNDDINDQDDDDDDEGIESLNRSLSEEIAADTTDYNEEIANRIATEISTDTMKFEGQDYNHWIVVMDFKEDNMPPLEEMVRIFEETCARGLNISVPDAKKKIYACSTTTGTFQVLMTEEESKKFNGLPGVFYVLPDAYIDPENKDYGGDRYENGKVTTRPPGFQNRRLASIKQQGSLPNQQGNSLYGQQGSAHGGGNYRTSQNYPNQPYAPPGQRKNRGHAPLNSTRGRDAYQPGSDQGNYNQEVQRVRPLGDQNTYAPPRQGEYRGNDWTYGYGHGPSSGTHGHGLSGLQSAGTGGSYGQGLSGGFYGQGHTHGHGLSGLHGKGTGGCYGQGPSGGFYRQGQSGGFYGQGPSGGFYGQGPNGGFYRHGLNGGFYGQGPNGGFHGQGPGAGFHGQGPGAGGYGHGHSHGHGLSGLQGPGTGGFFGHGPSGEF